MVFGHCFWERVVESKTRPMKLMNRRSKGEGRGGVQDCYVLRKSMEIVVRF